MGWPNKHGAQSWELDEFCKTYNQLRRRKLVPVDFGDRPDAIVRDLETGDYVSVELTSVYLDDRSVPDRHKSRRLLHIPYNAATVRAYLGRILDTVAAKAEKARAGYDLSLPLLLSIYVNEYESLFVSAEELKEFLESNARAIERCEPISEILFWPLVDGAVWRARGF